MATLAADAKRNFEAEPEPIFNDLPVIANDIIYEGAAVGDNASGYARPLAGGDPFLGFAARRADNQTVVGAAGDINVVVRSRGIVTLTVTGASAVTDRDAPVYATDDDTFTLTGGAGATLIGRVHRWVSSTTCQVFFVATALQHLQGGGASVAKTANYQLLASDHGKFFHTLGATGEVDFTLPAASAALAAMGWEATFFNAVDQVMKVIATAGQLVTFNNAAATSVALSTASEKIGGGFRVKCISSAKFACMPLTEESQTVTVA